MAEEYKPPRYCNVMVAGMMCREPATFVCVDAHGLQWYACNDHSAVGRVQTTIPIAEWWMRIAEQYR